MRMSVALESSDIKLGMHAMNKAIIGMKKIDRNL